jgi:Ca2+-transporting ATPase
VFCEKLNARYEVLREKVKTVENGVWLFSSERKRMSTLVIPQAKTPTSNGELPRFRLYTKGGSEIVLELCKTMLSSNGQSVTPITPNDLAFIQRNIKKWASQGLRTMVLAYRDTNQQLMTIEDNSKDDPEHDLTFIGLVGIKDPLRREVPGAVAVCQKAGITIRMVTGDNILTASKIARECGIMYGNGIALEGPIFRNMSREEKEAIIPKLQVLARSSPSDKHVLVSLLKELGEVVAVTGDGTNDAPALKEADVGFAMGISGTQIAMNASDIVLLDDNFVSIVQSIKWGRNVLNSVRKFLQFQLSVNLVAICITFVGSANQGESPLNTIQLLWVNLIMDSLGALGLATDDPSSDILLHAPHARNASLLSITMWENMFGQLIYQLLVLFGIYFGIEVFRPYRNTVYAITGTVEEVEKAANIRVNTMLFGTFVYLQVFNLVTSRQLDGEIGIFKDLLRNKIFVAVWVAIVVIQTLVLLFGNAFMNTSKIDSTDWQIIIAASAISLIFVFIQRVLMKIYHVYYPDNSTAHKVDPVMQDEVVVQKEGSVPVMAKIKKTTAHKETEEETQKLMGDMNERVTKILANVPKNTKSSSEDEVNEPNELPPRSRSNHSLKKEDLVNNIQKSVSKSELIDNSYTMEPENPTGDLRTTSRTTSLIELIHPFRKDSNAMPLKSSSTSRSTLSLKKLSKSSL